MRFPVAGVALADVTSGNQAMLSYSASRAGSSMALIISTPTVIGDLWMLDASRLPRRRLREGVAWASAFRLK